MFLIRKIRKTRWYNSNEVPWLQLDDLQADVFDDLQTVSNELSVYMVDENKSAINRIIAAISANSQHISVIDITVFDQQILDDLTIKYKKTPGELPDEWVNEYHLSLYELSAKQLLQLALFMKSTGSRVRTVCKDIESLVAESVNMKYIDKRKIKWGESDLQRIDAKIKLLHQ